ncbi:endonuclease [Candidatus Poribacteria bacterium]|nr:MAG: endonuclease [Candidatus Poribacteria bacterium]
MLKIRHSVKILILLFAVLLSFLGCEKIKMPIVSEKPLGESPPLTVMTYNVYLGSSVESVLGVENLLQVPTEVANVYNTFIASDFPGRAKGIAASIKAHQPDLVGLQEMSLIRRQVPGDRIAGGLVPAEQVVMDFRTVLLDALRAEGLDYRIVAEVENIDVEMPMFTDTGIVDVRLTDYDVILARSSVSVSRPTAVNFSSAYEIEMLGLAVKRGYAAVDATVGGQVFRFVNTHLEAFSEEVRVAQTRELIASLSDETLPIILLGDFNTPAPEGVAYQMLINAEYFDTWQVEFGGIGNTCCQDADLLNAVSGHVKRIDHIFVCNWGKEVTVLWANTIGDTPSDRLASGAWHSDHAGVLARIKP